MNKDILEIVESDFDNNEAIAKKYLDFKELNYRIEQTKHTKLPIESGGKHQKAHLESYALTPMHPEHTHENNQLE